MTAPDRSAIRGGTCIRWHAIDGSGAGKPYELVCDGRHLFSLRDIDGRCNTKRYATAELDRLLARGVISLDECKMEERRREEQRYNDDLRDRIKRANGGPLPPARDSGTD